MTPKPGQPEELLAEILARTVAGHVPWEAADKFDGFVFTGSKATVIIRSKDDDGAAPFVFEIYSTDNRLLESVRTDWVPTGDLDSSVDSAPQNDTLRALYEEARRFALDLDAVYASLLEDTKG